MVRDIKSKWINIRYSEDPAYGFVSGRIRVREKFLLDKERYERLLSEETESGFLSSLSDTPYAQFKERTVLDTLKAAEWENFFFLKRYAISSDLLEILLFPYDLHNIKLYNKSSKLSCDLALYSSPFGYFRYGNFPPEIAPLLKRGVSDDELEVSFFDYICAKSKNFPFLSEYLFSLSDVKNILALLRVVKFRLAEARFRFFPNSHLGEEFFIRLSSLPLSEISKNFPSPYEEILKETIPAVAAGDFGFLKLERRLMSLIFSYLRSTRYLTYGYELLSAYYIQKRQEIENIRRLYFSRFLYNITEPEVLRELIIFV